jgi:hypothetical protein
MMTLLPGLSEEQKIFAHAYYSLFDDVKSAVLMIAGIILLLRDDHQKTTNFQNNLETISEKFAGSVKKWAKFKPGFGSQQDYTAITRVLEKIASAIEDLDRSGTMLSDTKIAFLTSTLIDAYQQLRKIALTYWRLELVAESGHIVHTHNRSSA